MAQDTTAFRQVTYRRLPQTPGNWRWLECTLEAQRVLYNAALNAAANIRRRGLAMQHGEAAAPSGPMNREIDRKAAGWLAKRINPIFMYAKSFPFRVRAFWSGWRHD